MKTIRFKLFSGFCCIALLVLSSVSFAEEKPLFELGLGAGALVLPDYRGAKDTRGYLLPAIYPVYRGKFFQIDEDGIHGLLYKWPRAKLDFSADGSFPVDSDRIDIREDMPDLDPTFQLGPSLEISIWDSKKAHQEFIVSFPLRGVFAVNSGIEHIGNTFSPHVTYYRQVPWLDRDWRLGLSGGLEFGDNESHDYYYSVDEQFVRADRPLFDADAGYAGTRFIATFVSTTKKNWISFFARYDRVDDAAFEDSPLVLKKDGLTAGVVFTWFIWKSKKTVDVK